MSLWIIHGKGRCAGCFVYVLADSAEHAVRTLTADCFSPFYEVERVERFGVTKGDGAT